MKRLLVFLLMVIPIYAESKQGEVKLAEVESNEDGVLKYYKSKDNLLVKYFYSEDVMGLSGHHNALFLEILESEHTSNPVDIVSRRFVVGGGFDANVVKLRIPNKPPVSGCEYFGRATVKLSEIQVWVPEYPSEIDSTAKINSIISSTTPRFRCESIPAL